MSDIVERLRDLAAWDMPAAKEAAAEIERLRAKQREMALDAMGEQTGLQLMWETAQADLENQAAEVERLRAALREVRRLIRDCDALTSGELADCIAVVLDGLGDAP